MNKLEIFWVAAVGRTIEAISLLFVMYLLIKLRKKLGYISTIPILLLVSKEVLTNWISLENFISNQSAMLVNYFLSLNTLWIVAILLVILNRLKKGQL
jgi:hypothetical protein